MGPHGEFLTEWEGEGTGPLALSLGGMWSEPLLRAKMRVATKNSRTQNSGKRVHSKAGCSQEAFHPTGLA